MFVWSFIFLQKKIYYISTRFLLKPEMGTFHKENIQGGSASKYFLNRPRTIVTIDALWILLLHTFNNNCQPCILGTRICLECTPIHRHITKGHNEPVVNGTSVSAYRTKHVDETSSSCSAAALTEMPIRKFRINHTCHGKLTFLTKNLSLKCNCRKGLHYELV